MTSSGLADRPPRGILGLPGRLPYRVTRTAPSDRLSWCIDRFWTSEWELPPGRAVTARVLPHPTVNLTWERHPPSVGSGGPATTPRQLIITGVARGVFTRTLTGTDRAFGIKLRPGVARLLTDVAITELSGNGQPADAVWSAALRPTGRELQDALAAAPTDADRITAAESFFAAIDGPSERLTTVQHGVRALIGDPAVRRVTDVTTRLGVSERTLQRLFGEYLGLSPGWVLRRGRLHAAAERLIQLAAAAGAGSGRRAVLAEVAAEYGYADQAHLTGDFTKIIRMPPNSWLNTLIAEHAIG
ncbi:AraC family transcriptional regulator [Microlunatus soli]|uniref:Helix-turn-helix domain-containing protein n=1 Tax=Microlunatus soli TaxID=630515 RepID=A0A1H1WWM0_9ACTN|nr:helix-turn-helix domain-containing protein [Microlunatus soli]SDT01563.1 Helix-turn-helix domain-containing protein [Microlunatus soli]